VNALADIPCTVAVETCYRQVQPGGDTLGVTSLTWVPQTNVDTYGLLLGLLLFAVLMYGWLALRYWEPRFAAYEEDTDLLAVVNAMGGIWPEDVDTRELRIVPKADTVEV
jgi:hypothetical protein